MVSAETKILLEQFWKYTQDCSGLPRGINLSATLSEIYMNIFDHKIIITKFVKKIGGQILQLNGDLRKSIQRKVNDDITIIILL